MKIGFIGTGTISEAIVTGIANSNLAVEAICVSPRSKQKAGRLTASFPIVSAASDNQKVSDICDVVFLAVRPQVAQSVLEELRFRDDQTLISLIATLNRDQLAV
jgi:pyrroline-5-carboxylate reductase